MLPKRGGNQGKMLKQERQHSGVPRVTNMHQNRTTCISLQYLNNFLNFFQLNNTVSLLWRYANCDGLRSIEENKADRKRSQRQGVFYCQVFSFELIKLIGYRLLSWALMSNSESEGNNFQSLVHTSWPLRCCCTHVLGSQTPQDCRQMEESPRSQVVDPLPTKKRFNPVDAAYHGILGSGRCQAFCDWYVYSLRLKFSR